MKQNILQNVINFTLKYIWIFCALLIVLETVSVTYTASILMRQSAIGVMQSVSGDISGRVDGVLRLLKGMTEDERFADTSKPLFDRAIQALPYQESYDLYMIALTDKDINVVTADTKEPPTKFFSMAHRAYMQRMHATGKYEITDAFLSGDGKNTMNYTIAVPILKDGIVEGSVFGSIHFNDIEEIVSQRSQHKGRDFYLLSSENTIMTDDDKANYGQSFLELSEGNRFFDADVNSLDQSMKAGESGDFWEWDKQGLTYVTYQRVAPTNWTLLYRVEFISIFAYLLPVLSIKIVFYILMCAFLYIFGRRYLNRQLSQVNHLLNRMTAMQKELFQSEQADYDNLLELTHQGLTDQLTGLSTRAILFKKIKQLTNEPAVCGAIVFIDLDDLKRINDNFGHEGGDCALLYFARILKEYEQKYNGLAARYGGDEFIFTFLAPDVKSASEVAQSLCAELNTTIVMDKHTFTIHGSLGVSFYPEHGTNIEELICKADLALYNAKQKGKNQCAFFVADDSVL